MTARETQEYAEQLVKKMPMDVQKTAKSLAEDLTSRLKVYIVKKVKTDLNDGIIKVSPTERCSILTSLIDGQKRTALHHAAIRGDGDVIDAIFDSVTDDQIFNLLNLGDTFGDTSPALAAYHGQVDALQQLFISNNPSINYEILKYKNKKGFSVLHWSACQEKFEVVEFITKLVTIEQLHSLQELKDNKGNTAIALAAYYGHAEAVQLLLENLKPDERLTMVSTQNKSGQPAFHIAANGGHTKVIKAIVGLVQEEEKDQLPVILDRNGNTAIALAANGGHIETVKHILNVVNSNVRFTMLNLQNKSELSALHMAAWTGQYEVISAILDRTTKEQKYSLLKLVDRNSDTAIATAASYGHANSVKSILKAADVSWRYEVLKKLNKSGQSALHRAAWNGHHEVLREIFGLIQKEESILLLLPEHDEETTTVIYLAAYNGHIETVNEILSAVDSETKFKMLKVKNKAGQSVLHILAHQGHTDAFQAVAASITEDQLFNLLSLTDKKKETPLSLAVRKGHAGTVSKVLTSVDVDKQIDILLKKDSIGHPILHQAAVDGLTDVLEAITNIVAKEQIYELLILPESNGNTAIALAAMSGHTTTVEFILSYVEDPTKKYEMLKMTNKDGRSTAHIAALKGHTNILMAIMGSIAGEQLFDLLFNQQDDDGNTTIEFVKKGGHNRTEETMTSFKTQYLNQLNEGNDNSDANNESEEKKREKRKSEEFPHTGSDSCLKCKESLEVTEQLLSKVDELTALLNSKDELIERLKEEVEQLRVVGQSMQSDEAQVTQLMADQNALITQLKEREQLLEAKTAEITDKEREIARLANQTFNQTQQIVEMTKEMEIQCRQIEDNREEKRLFNNGILELEKTVEGYEEQVRELTHVNSQLAFKQEPDMADIPAVVEAGATDTDDGSSDDSCAAIVDDYDERTIPVELKRKLKSFCLEQQIESLGIHQNPADSTEILVSGKQISTISKDEWNKVLHQNDSWRLYHIRTKDVEGKQIRQYMPSRIKKFSVELFNGTCELLSEGQRRRNNNNENIKLAAYAVGPAHMMFDEQTNQNLQQGIGLEEERQNINNHPPDSLYQIHFRAGDEGISVLEAFHPPLFNYRYERQELANIHQLSDDAAPPPLDICLNDMVLFSISYARAEGLHNHQRLHQQQTVGKMVDINSMRMLRRYVSPGPVPFATIPIVVRNLRGVLVRQGSIEEQLVDEQACRLRFKLTRGELELGDSGSIVYEVRQKKNGGKVWRPLGMFTSSEEDPYLGTVYQAAILSLAFQDISAIHNQSITNITVFNTTGNRDKHGKLLPRRVQPTDDQPRRN